ncbi:MAG: hypothetical protein ACKVOR_07550 [Flavobacteriales bacterium]
MKLTELRLLRLVLTSWLFTLFMTACNNQADQSAIVAKVGDKELTWIDLSEIIPDNTNSIDSAQLAESYIQNWVKQQVLINHAEASLSDDKKSFDEMIENYRTSLLTYTYEQEWLRQKLDTVVVEEEIVKYYNDNEQNFELKGYILKVKFCAIASDSKALPGLKKLFAASKPEDHVKLEKYCVDNGASFYFDEDRWMLWEDFIKQIPLGDYDAETFLKKNKQFNFEKENNYYLIAITNYQLDGSRSPLSFERDKIRSMIINKRKTELLEQMREDLYQKALQEKQIETYYQTQ